MVHIFKVAAASVTVLALSSTAFAQQPLSTTPLPEFQRAPYGTANEARIMLLKAVLAVQANKAKALDMFNKGESGFRDRDLYPFCFDSNDGKVVAIGNPNAKQLLGQDSTTFKDSAGKPVGLEQFAAAQKPEGEITEVSYLFP